MPAAGQPDGHGLVVVVAAVAPLRHRGAAELAGPDDQGLVQHPSLLQVDDQGHAGAVDLLGLEGDPLLHAAVMIPVFMVELDETHAALGQPAGEQAVGGERAVARAGSRRARASVRLSPRTSISSGTLACIRNAISYWTTRVAISGSCAEASYWRVKRVDGGDVGALLLARDAGRGCQVEDRVALAREAARPGSGWAGSRCSTAARRSAGSAPPCPGT